MAKRAGAPHISVFQVKEIITQLGIGQVEPSQLSEQEWDRVYAYAAAPNRTARLHLVMAQDNTPVGVDTVMEKQHTFIQVITTPTSDTAGTTLCFNFNNRRYLFGRVAEGTQRAFTEHGVAVRKTRDMFLTGETKWESNSGLLGMILTIADFRIELDEAEKESLGDIQIYGGPKLWHSIACARRFIFRNGLPVRVFEDPANGWDPQTEVPDYSDENVLVWNLPVHRAQRRHSAPTPSQGRSSDPETIQQEQQIRAKTVHDMFDSGWRKDRLHELPFKDVNLPATIWLRNQETKALESTYCMTREDAPHIAPDQIVQVRMPWPGALISRMPPADNLPDSVAMSYIVKGRPQRGSFQRQKAQALGVPHGPLFGKLTAGLTVTLDDGRVITPDQVMSPPDPAQGFAVLDIPDAEYVPDLSNKLADLKKLNILAGVHNFIWILNSGIVSSRAFSELRAQLPQEPDARHFIASPDVSPDEITFVSSASSSVRMNRIRPDTFKIPRHVRQPKPPLPEGISLLETGSQIPIVPRNGPVRNNVAQPFDVPTIVESMDREVRGLIPAYKSVQPGLTNAYDDIKISTLGTGSAVPSKYRNVSGNLVQIPSLGNFILDAGENTLGQLRRLFTPNELEDILCNLHMIWISHLHADHHLGTISLLQAHKQAVARRAASGRPVEHNLYVISERHMADYFDDYSSVESFPAHYLRVDKSRVQTCSGQSIDIVRDTTLPIRKLATTRVVHCQGAQAVSITFKNGFKLSYSGDCRPSASFAEIGSNSDVLIHEATFDDHMMGDAMAKQHSTIGEALGVASAMRAKNVILTHFSQRYQKLPELRSIKSVGQVRFEEADGEEDDGPIEEAQLPSTVENGSIMSLSAEDHSSQLPISRGRVRSTPLSQLAQQMSVCVAFDLMQVTIPQIKDMYKYFPALERMFETEQRKSDRQRQMRHEENQRYIEARAGKRQQKAQAQSVVQEASKKKQKVRNA